MTYCLPPSALAAGVPVRLLLLGLVLGLTHFHAFLPLLPPSVLPLSLPSSLPSLVLINLPRTEMGPSSCAKGGADLLWRFSGRCSRERVAGNEESGGAGPGGLFFSNTTMSTQRCRLFPSPTLAINPWVNTGALPQSAASSSKPLCFKMSISNNHMREGEGG